MRFVRMCVYTSVCGGSSVCVCVCMCVCSCKMYIQEESNEAESSSR